MEAIWNDLWEETLINTPHVPSIMDLMKKAANDVRTGNILTLKEEKVICNDPAWCESRCLQSYQKIVTCIQQSPDGGAAMLEFFQKQQDGRDLERWNLESSFDELLGNKMCDCDLPTQHLQSECQGVCIIRNSPCTFCQNNLTG